MHIFTLFDGLDSITFYAIICWILKVTSSGINRSISDANFDETLTFCVGNYYCTFNCNKWAGSDDFTLTNVSISCSSLVIDIIRCVYFMLIASVWFSHHITFKLNRNHSVRLRCEKKHTLNDFSFIRIKDISNISRRFNFIVISK